MNTNFRTIAAHIGISRVPALGLALLAFLSCGVSAFAQETRGTILGAVHDSHGGVIASADVVATDSATNASTKVSTNESGAFEIPYLIPGTYNVSVEAKGFKKVVRQGVVVNVGSRANIEITLEAGVITEEVVVTAAAPLLETTSASGSAVLENQVIRSLPVFGNNAMLVVRALPGIQWTGQPNYLGLHSNIGSSQISAAGGVGGTEFVLDGIPNSGISRRAGFIPETDAIDEVRISSSEFDAKQGHTSGAVMNMVTKSGNNNFHGTISWLHWQQRWNATPTFTKSTRGAQIGAALAAGDTALAEALRQQELQTAGRSNTYAATIGGPVRLPHLWNGRDKLFFFFAFNGYKEVKSEEVTAINRTVPTAAHRRGDFSDLLKLGPQFQIYDPRTARLVGGRVVRDPFPNNQVPILNPIYNAIVKLYPLPNNPNAGPADPNNYIASATPFNWDYKAFQNRIDANISSKSKLTGKWSYNSFLEDRGDWTFETARGLNSNGLVRRNIGIGAEYVRTLSATTFLRFTVGYNRFIEGGQLNAVQTSFNAAKIGLPNYIDQRAAGKERLPDINFSAYSNLSGGYPGFTRVSVADTGGEISKIFSKHTLRAGYDFRQNYRASNGPGNSEGQYQFRNSFVRACDSNASTAPCNLVNSAPARGFEWAAFMLGVPTSVFIDRNDTLYMTNPFVGGYVQDDWRVSRRLMLNLGFRYEREGGFRERFNRGLSQFDPNAQLPIADAAKAAYAKNPIPELPVSQFDVRGGSLYLGLNGAPTILNEPQPAYMPRVGFAYQWNSKTVFRGGYGLFYDTNNVLNFGLDQFGFSRSTGTTLTNNNGLTLENTNLQSAECKVNPSACRTIMSDPFPQRADGTRFNEPFGNQLGIMARAGRGFTFVNQDWKRARQQRWRFGVQRELSNSMVLEVAYLGSYTDNITTVTDNPGDNQTTRRIDFLPQQYWVTGLVPNTANDTFLNTTVPNPFNIANFGFLQTQNPVLYQDMSTNGFFTSTTIRRSQLLRAFPHMNGVTIARVPDVSLKYHHMETSLTKRFSHGVQFSVSYQWASSQIKDFRQNEFDTERVYRQNTNYRPHSLRLNGLFELPFGKGHRFVSEGLLGKLIGNWQVAPVYYLQSGRTYDFGNLIFFGSTRDIELSKDQQNVDNWFNWRLFPRAQRDFSTTNPQPYRDRIRQIVPKSFMDAIGKTYDNVVPTDFALDSFHTRIFPSRFNWLRGARLNQVDINIQRTFPIRENLRLEFSTDFINSFNHVVYDNPNTDPTSNDFGKVTQQWNTPRWIQFKARITF
ncbi:MAG TPA: carboxypeptidase-like regulatory domain-containing protein [Blastocatellia bacterium]